MHIATFSDQIKSNWQQELFDIATRTTNCPHIPKLKLMVCFVHQNCDLHHTTKTHPWALGLRRLCCLSTPQFAGNVSAARHLQRPGPASMFFLTKWWNAAILIHFAMIRNPRQPEVWKRSRHICGFSHIDLDHSRGPRLAAFSKSLQASVTVTVAKTCHLSELQCQGLGDYKASSSGGSAPRVDFFNAEIICSR